MDNLRYLETTIEIKDANDPNDGRYAPGTEYRIALEWARPDHFYTKVAAGDLLTESRNQRMVFFAQLNSQGVGSFDQVKVMKPSARGSGLFDRTYLVKKTKYDAELSSTAATK